MSVRNCRRIVNARLALSWKFILPHPHSSTCSTHYGRIILAPYPPSPLSALTLHHTSNFFFGLALQLTQSHDVSAVCSCVHLVAMNHRRAQPRIVSRSYGHDLKAKHLRLVMGCLIRYCLKKPQSVTSRKRVRHSLCKMTLF